MSLFHCERKRYCPDWVESGRLSWTRSGTATVVNDSRVGHGPSVDPGGIVTVELGVIVGNRLHHPRGGLAGNAAETVPLISRIRKLDENFIPNPCDAQTDFW